VIPIPRLFTCLSSTFGNSGRLHRRGFKNWDLIAVRNFPSGCYAVSGEFFNFTNAPAFGGPVANVQAGNVGQILSAGDTRSIQLALKLMW
jgi:hypothetical protein